MLCHERVTSPPISGWIFKMRRSRPDADNVTFWIAGSDAPRRGNESVRIGAWSEANWSFPSAVIWAAPMISTGVVEASGLGLAQVEPGTWSAGSSAQEVE